MIFIEPAHKIIREVLQERFNAEKPEHVDVKTGDFDGSHYHIYADPKSKNILTVSVYVKCADSLKKYGMDAILKQQYGDLVQATPQEGYTVTLAFDLEKLDEATKTKYLNEIPLLKRYVMMAPLVSCFDKFLKGDRFDTITIPYREDENMHICFEKESLVVVFSLRFRDADDIILAKVFLQEFQDARRDREVSNAPAVSYSHGKKPLELKNVPETEDEKTGFVSFVLFKRHIEEKQRIKTIDNLLNFRNYFHYHLKCAKAYMHIRMRDRVAKSLQVLNRAKVEEVEKKQMKTASGRTFTRS